MSTSDLKYRIGLVGLCITLTACVTVPPNSGQTNFSGYAESVFKHQNAVSSRMMLLSDSDVPFENEEIENAEEAMSDACHFLNEYADRESSGESSSLQFKTKVQASIVGCDQSVQRLEALLNKQKK
ncbi:hypothetical protein [Methylomonas sp. AM2-LC]|uniref:hypothetical protein n=1 Tax=Methylomonas sp. AM2-LC TaxID=3153301 RepID=UPI0032663583